MIHKEFIPSTLEVLGYDENMRTIIWSNANKELYRINNFAELTRPRLIQLATLAEMIRIEKHIRTTIGDDVKPLVVITSSIAEESRKQRFETTETLGAGVWKDPTGDGLLIISGKDRLGFKFDRQITIIPINTPVIGGRLIDTSGAWLNIGQFKSVLAALSPASIKLAYKELLAHLSRWNFRDEMDYQLVGGLIAATSIQATLPFRAHASITGKVYSGKSTLRDLLAALWPHVIKAESASTPRGIQDEVGNSTRPLLFDEFDKAKYQQDVLEWLRSSTGDGGYILKMNFAVRLSHIVWLFGIVEGYKTEADNSRFARIVLESSTDLPQARTMLPQLADLGTRLLAGAMVKRDEILARFEQLSSADLRGEYQRLAQVYAVAVAFHTVMLGQPLAEAVIMLNAVLAEKKEALAGKIESDEHELLATILNSSPRGQQSTIARLLDDTWGNEIELANVGIRKLEIDGSRFVFVNHRLLISSCLSQSKFRNVDVQEMLERLPGAHKSRQRINGQRAYGVMIPWATVMPPDTDPIEPYDIPF